MQSPLFFQSPSWIFFLCYYLHRLQCHHLLHLSSDAQERSHVHDAIRGPDALAQLPALCVSWGHGSDPRQGSQLRAVSHCTHCVRRDRSLCRMDIRRLIDSIPCHYWGHVWSREFWVGLDPLLFLCLSNQPRYSVLLPCLPFSTSLTRYMSTVLLPSLPTLSVSSSKRLIHTVSFYMLFAMVFPPL